MCIASTIPFENVLIGAGAAALVGFWPLSRVVQVKKNAFLSHVVFSFVEILQFFLPFVLYFVFFETLNDVLRDTFSTGFLFDVDEYVGLFVYGLSCFILFYILGRVIFYFRISKDLITQREKITLTGFFFLLVLYVSPILYSSLYVSYAPGKEKSGWMYFC